jgi:hypothetical protein
MANSLETTLAAVQSYAVEKGVPLIFGIVRDPELAMATIQVGSDTDDETGPGLGTGDDVTDFLAAITAFDIQALVATVLRVEAEEWEDAQAAWAAADSELGEQFAGHLTHAKETLIAAGDPVGHIAELTLSAITQQPSIFITQRILAPWYYVVVGYDSILSHIRGDDEGADDENPHTVARQEAWRRQEEENQARAAEHRKWSGAKRSEIITQLANHPKFPACKKEEARMLLFSRIVGDTEVPQDRELVRTITREALALYDLEVRGN